VLTIEGTITNTGSTPLRGIDVTAVGYKNNGNVIVGEGHAYPLIGYYMLPGQSVEFEVHIWDEKKQSETYSLQFDLE
jgi:hypothetical protein